MKYLSILIFLFVFLISANGQVKPERQWSSYRGYMSSGVLDKAGLPENFDVRKGINIKWKTVIPGMGLSSPVIWGDRLFITTAVSQDDRKGLKPGLYGDVTSVKDSSVHEWKVLCLDKNTGKILWERTSFKGIPKIKRHPKSTHANSSVATDGKYAVAFFGSEGLYCYDMKGKLMWQKDFGVLRSVFFLMKNAEWEFASSPIIYKGVVIIQCDVLEGSFIATFDAATGKQIWRTERNEYPGWCTPNIYFNNGKPCIAVNGFKERAGYDFETGKQLWKMSGGGDIQIPTPLTGSDLIYFNSAHGRNSPIMAVKTDASGDITLEGTATTNAFVAWSLPRGGSYMHTMLLYRDRLYNVDWPGTIKCLDPLTGAEIWVGKIGRAKSFVASPVASDGKIYIVDEEGTIFIIAAGDKFELLSEIPTDDISLVAPAITDGIIFFRTQKYLIAAGKN